MRRELDDRVHGCIGRALEEGRHRFIHSLCAMALYAMGLDAPELRRGCQAKETQSCVSVLDHARTLDPVEKIGQLRLSVMLHNH